MELTGRVTADAAVRTTKTGKKVTGFTIAMNRTYKKDNEKKTVATFVDCSYWINSGVAEYLKKGTLVQVYGDIDATAWIDKEGKARGQLIMHTQKITILSKSGGYEGTGNTNSKFNQSAGANGNADDDDLPF